jgi:hypothetical protein
MGLPKSPPSLSIFSKLRISKEIKNPSEPNRKTSLPTGITDATNAPVAEPTRKFSLPTDLINKLRRKSELQPELIISPSNSHQRAEPELAMEIPKRTWSNKECQSWLEVFCYDILHMTEKTSFRVSQEFKGNGEDLFRLTRAQWDCLFEIFGWQKRVRTEGDAAFKHLHEGEKKIAEEAERIKRDEDEMYRKWHRGSVQHDWGEISDDKGEGLTS